MMDYTNNCSTQDFRKCPHLELIFIDFVVVFLCPRKPTLCALASNSVIY